MHRFWTFSLVLAAGLLLLIVPDAFARAGGGGGKGGGILALVFWPFFVLYGVYIGFRINRKKKVISEALAKMAAIEPQWAEERLLALARERFMILQAAWGNQDLDTIEKYLHPALFRLWQRDIRSQQARHERNVMCGISIDALRIVDVKNFQDDEKDEFTLAIDARADDQTLVNDQITKHENSKFREFWTFEWEKGEWLLREVTQSSGWKRFVNAAILYEPPVARPQIASADNDQDRQKAG
jgi:predicted lipid-binding transport protein (Tim44 family)